MKTAPEPQFGDAARRKSVFDGLLRIPNFLQKFGIHLLLNVQGNPDG